MKKILIDSDTGIDDAMAFVHGFLIPEIDILSVTAVFGNASMQDCANHAIEIIDLMGKEVPVIAGATKPLISGCGAAPEVHGAYGRGALGPLENGHRIAPGHAATHILEQVRTHGSDLTIVAMGRLTNIAIACSLDPDLMKTVGRIYWMGGVFSVSGNTSPVAEANLHGDPEAARIVLGAGLPLTVLPLDVTMQTLISHEDIRSLERSSHPGVRHLTQIVPYYLDAYERIIGVRKCAGHCGLLLAIAAYPELQLETEDRPITVETSGEFARGMLVVDRRNQPAPRPLDVPLSTLVVKADQKKYHEMFMQTLQAA